MKKIRKNYGITLIALVVTIIVLLILAGVTIATLIGENGILTRTQEARNETKQEQKDEENILNSYEDQINEYAGIDWDTALANAQKHPEQKTSTATGVGTDGKAVNMDLWQYTLLDDGTYLVSYSPDEKNIVDGKIKGNIPQYIKDEIDDDFIEVTSLENCFINNKNLKYSPKIPSTIIYLNGTFANCEVLEEPPVVPQGVIEMRSTFSGCVSLQEMPEIPNSVQILNSTFANCGLIEKMKVLPDSIISMANAFNGCTNLENISNIPKNVQNMNATFNSCNSIGNVDLIIPNTVTDFQSTFQNCTNMSGNIEINASVDGSLLYGYSDYANCFKNAAINLGCIIQLTGTCQVLQQMVTQSNNPNILIVN